VADIQEFLQDKFKSINPQYQFPHLGQNVAEQGRTREDSQTLDMHADGPLYDTAERGRRTNGRHALFYPVPRSTSGRTELAIAILKEQAPRYPIKSLASDAGSTFSACQHS